MENGRIVEEILSDSNNRIQRRINMLGQNLTNEGFTDVKVSVSITVEGSDGDGSGSFKLTRSGSYGKMTEGNGLACVGGTSDVDSTLATPVDPILDANVSDGSADGSDGSGVVGDYGSGGLPSVLGGN